MALQNLTLVQHKGPQGAGCIQQVQAPLSVYVYTGLCVHVHVFWQMGDPEVNVKRLSQPFSILFFKTVSH